MWGLVAGARRRRPPSPGRHVLVVLRRRPLTVVLGGLLLPALGTAALLLWPSGEVPVPVAPAAAAEPALSAAPDGQVLRLQSGGRARAVLVQDPVRVPATGLVLVLGPHGLTAARTASDLDLSALRRRGFALAFPSTLDGDWNAGRCCGSPHREGVDDVGFLREVRGRMLERYGLPGDRVGLVGYSTGGQMAYRTVCEHPSFASAVVVVGASLETDCAPDGPLPDTLAVHGLGDTTVPWFFTTHRTRLLDYATAPALPSVERYARAAGCTPVSDGAPDRTDGRWLYGWVGCAGGSEVVLIGMPDSGHGWAALAGSVYVDRFLPSRVAPP